MRERFNLPDEVLVLPGGTNTGDLVDNDTIVVQQVVQLAQPFRVAADTDVLGHLEARNLVVGGTSGDITVVLAENASLISSDLSKRVSRGHKPFQGDETRTPLVAILSVANLAWFSLRVTPVLSHPKFLAA
jgi:hypothetical protein